MTAVRAGISTGFFLLCSFIPGATSADSTVPPIAEGALVRTLAGNGIAGNRDGSATQAEFVFPVAVAFDKHSRAMFVADYSGQRIRKIDGTGRVSTVAGGGRLFAKGSVDGGYADGPARAARFREPAGVALGAAGEIYVADSHNHVIRMIKNGTVSTYAGNVLRPGTADGARLGAEFKEPRGLSMGPEGTLYVADFGAGIRAISPNGSVRTLPIDPAVARTVTSVSSISDQGYRMLFFVNREGMERFNLANEKLESDPPAIAYKAYGVQALSWMFGAISSPAYNAIYLHHYGPQWRRMAGYGGQDTADSGGYRDGTPAAARFYAPMGLALDGNGNIIVADAGNRRIRLVPAVSPRWQLGIATPPQRDPAVYNIIYVGNSYVFANAVWGDSIEGIIERRLNRDAPRIGLQRKVRVDVTGVPGTSLKALASYTDEVLGQGSVDMVILGLNTLTFHNEEHPENYVFELPVFTPANVGNWTATLRTLCKNLEGNGTRLLLVDTAFGYDLSPTEQIEYRDDASFGQPQWFNVLRDPGHGFAENTAIDEIISTSGCPYMATYSTFVRYERGAHSPLYAEDDYHFSSAGNAFLANLLVDYLERLRPWSAHDL